MNKERNQVNDLNQLVTPVRRHVQRLPACVNLKLGFDVRIAVQEQPHNSLVAGWPPGEAL
jgi:hypothetical protein